MNSIELYKKISESLDLLAKAAGVTDLEKYYSPIEGKSYYELLSESLQESSMMHNSIKFNGGNYENIKNALSDFDYEAVADNYSNWNALYDAFIKNGIADNGKKNKKETNWQKYAKGLIDGAKYLQENPDKINTLKKHIPENYLKEIEEIKKEIHGLGFALTCNWLKECGCTWLAKPDIHIKTIVAKMTGNKPISDNMVVEYMYKWAENLKSVDSNITAYKLDRMIWLLCTGDFYLDSIKIGRGLIENWIGDSCPN